MAGLEASGGGTHLWQEHQKADYDSMNRMGTMPLQFVLDAMLGALFYDYTADDYKDGCVGRSFEVTKGVAGLDVDVRPGLALWHDSAAADDYNVHYKPIFLDVETTKTADVADGALDRYDILSIAPLYVNDKSYTRYFKDPTTQVISTNSVATRRRYSATVLYTAGPPGGTYPATPAGHQLIAKFKVAAGVSTVVNIIDPRAQLALPGTLPVDVSHRAFVSQDGADEVDRDTSTTTVFSDKGVGTPHPLGAHLALPDGHKIDSLAYRSLLNHTGSSVQVDFVKVDRATGVQTVIATDTRTGAPTGYLTTTISDVNEAIDNDAYSYALEVILTSATAIQSARLLSVRFS